MEIRCIDAEATATDDDPHMAVEATDHDDTVHVIVETEGNTALHQGASTTVDDATNPRGHNVPFFDQQRKKT